MPKALSRLLGGKARHGAQWLKGPWGWDAGHPPVTMTELLEGATAFSRRGKECFLVWAKLGSCRGPESVIAEDGGILCAHLQGRRAGHLLHAARERFP